MPLVQLPHTDIELNIPDLAIGQTLIKRKAKLFSLVYNTQAGLVVVTWIVSHYASENGQAGERITAIPDYSFESIADNNTMCNVDSSSPDVGNPIQKIVAGKDDEGNDILDYDPAIPYAGQYDFFNYLAENSPVLIHALIRKFGAQIPAEKWNK